MKKTIHKTTTKCLALIVLMLVTMLTGAQADTVTTTATFNSSVWGTSNKSYDSGETDSWTSNGVTMTLTADWYTSYINSSGMDVYFSGNLTFTVPTGCTLTGLTITGSGNAVSASTGTLTANATSGGYTWSGSASTLTLSPGADGRDLYSFESIVVTYEADLNILATTTSDGAEYRFHRYATPFVGVSLNAKTITAGSQEMYLLVGSEDPMIMESPTNGSTYLHMPAGSTMRLQKSENGSNVYITRAAFTCVSGNPDVYADGGEYDSSTGIWTGQEEQVDITFNEAADIQLVQVDAAAYAKVSITTYGRGQTAVDGVGIDLENDLNGNPTGSTTVYVAVGNSLALAMTPDDARHELSTASVRESYWDAEDNYHSDETDFLNDAKENGSYTIWNIQHDCSVTIRYSWITHLISYHASGNGTINLVATYLDDDGTSMSYDQAEQMYGGEAARDNTEDRKISIGTGGTVNMIMTADNGYKLSSLIVNDAEMVNSENLTQDGNVYTYTITPLTAAQNISATFVNDEPQPYAVLSEDESGNPVLTFMYDTNKSEGDFEVTTFANYNTRGWDGRSENIKTVVFDESFKNYQPTSTAYWFYGMTNLTDIQGIGNLNTSAVTSMNSMFSRCSSLIVLDLSNFVTSQVTNMANMFAYCSALTTIYAGDGWSTESIQYSANMFIQCPKLVGSKGTTVTDTGATYARIDGGESAPGYLSDPNAPTAYDVLVKVVGNGSVNAGSLTISGGSDEHITMPAGGNLKMFLSPATGYKIDKVELDGVNKNDSIVPATATAAASYTLWKIYDTHTVTVTFANDTDEPYAVLDGNTLTFYYNKQKEERQGMSVGPFSSEAVRGWNDNRESITRVVFDESFKNYQPTSTAYWFMNMFNLTEIEGMSYLMTQNVTDMRDMFEGCNNLRTLDVSGFDTRNVTQMNAMFYYCMALTSLDVRSFNTANVTDMQFMFDGCSSLTNLDLTTFNTQNVSNMRYMFDNCSSLTTIYVGSEWSTAAVTSSDNMFTGCTSLVGSKGTTYDAEHTDATYARIDGGEAAPGYFTDINAATAYDVLVKVVGNGSVNSGSLTISGGSEEHITMPAGGNLKMFLSPATGYKIDKVELDGVNKNDSIVPATATAAASYTLWKIYDTHTITVTFVNDTDEPYAVLNGNTLTFYYDKQKESRGGITFLEDTTVNWPTNMENVTNAVIDSTFVHYLPTSTANLFNGFNNLTAINGIENLNTINVTDMSSMFYNCWSLTSLDVTGFTTQNVTDMSRMFYCSSLTSLDVTGFNTQNVTDMSGMFWGCYNLPSLDLSGFKTQNVTNMKSMFDGCSGLTSLDLSDFNTQNVTDMSSMFCDCSALTSLDVTGFTTQNVTDMSRMFEGCSSLTSLDVTGFNTQNVTDMSRMFYLCSGLTSLDVTGFKTQNLTNVFRMFSTCSSLTSLDLSGFNTQNVTEMFQMFYDCSALMSLDLSGFNTQNVWNMGCMFEGCSGLTSLDLSGFNTQNVTYMQEMFERCSGLTTIYVGSAWSTTAVTSGSYMFDDCTNLVGGRGTAYNASYTDATYARIDMAPDAPGYFTRTVVMGDANDDGSITIADAVATVTNILGEPAEDYFSQTKADMNNDSEIDIFDVTLIVNAVLAASPAPAFNGGNIAAEDVRLEAQANSLAMGIDGSAQYTAFQFDVTLPEGTTLEGVRLASGATNHQLAFQKVGDNTYRVVGLSMTNQQLSAANGRLVQLQLSGNADESNVKMSNVLFVGQSATDATAIRNHVTDGAADRGAIYDLNGRYVGNDRRQLSKGIYIINHKKVNIK